MTLKEFTVLSQHAVNRHELMMKLERLVKPTYLSGKRVPDSLNDISIGQLLMLQYMSTDEDFMLKPASIILGILRFPLPMNFDSLISYSKSPIVSLSVYNPVAK